MRIMIFRECDPTDKQKKHPTGCFFVTGVEKSFPIPNLIFAYSTDNVLPITGLVPKSGRRTSLTR